jgi:catechol 2,3-dioxygenase-like lactoylglutathione lyase family enzyme
MLKDKPCAANIAVTDIKRARTFYEDTLGLELEREVMGGVLVFKSGASSLIVYPSEFAATNKATSASWSVGEELEAIVAGLKAKGVTFEHYDNIGTLDGDIHVAGPMKMVWLKDPDGNTLHVNNG